MSAIPFSMLGSSGATQSQVSEFQPFPEKLLTEYFMFGYQFDPSNWVALNPRTGPYNPMNDLLNPLSVDSNELLQRQSIEYIEEQMLRQRWNDIKEKELFIRMVPERLRKTVGDLYDRGIFRASLSQTEMDKTIDSLITQGTLGTYDAGRLRALIGQRATFSTLTSQRTAENNIGELEAIISQVEDALRAEGIGQGNTRQLAREAVDMAIERIGTSAPELIIREAFVKARQRLEDLEDQEGSPTIGGRPANIDDYSTEQEITDSQALMEAGVGLGSRLSAPTGIKIPGTLTTTGVEAFAFPLDPPTATIRGTPFTGAPTPDPISRPGFVVKRKSQAPSGLTAEEEAQRIRILFAQRREEEERLRREGAGLPRPRGSPRSPRKEKST